MRRLLRLLPLIVLLVLAGLLLGRRSPEAEAAPAAAAAPAPQARSGDDEDTFRPSERLPADSSISFPVDI